MFAQMAYDRKHFAIATRLWSEAAETDPKLAADREAQHRYNAACAAALASAGQGRDAPRPDAATKSKLRHQLAQLSPVRAGRVGPGRERRTAESKCHNCEYAPALEGGSRPC